MFTQPYLSNVFQRRHEGSTGTRAMQPLLCVDSTKSSLPSLDYGEWGQYVDGDQGVNDEDDADQDEADEDDADEDDADEDVVDGGDDGCKNHAQ